MKYLSYVSFVILLSTHLTRAQTITWQDSLSQAVIYLAIDQKDYHDHPHRTSPAYNVRESAQEYHQDILKVANRALRKYPSAVLNRHVEKIYIYDQFDKENKLDGVYRGRHGFLYNVIYLKNGQIDTLETERLIHHEISHRLLMFEGKQFDFKAWKQANGLKYGKIKSYNRDFDPDLYGKGFINKYAVMNKHEDFAAFAENIFIYKPVFWKAIEENPVLRSKFEIICEYYESLDSAMNRAYFLELNNVSLEDNP